MSQNFYKQTIEDIKKLIKEDKIETAKKMVDKELNMPYVPAKYEKIFLELQGQINFKLISDIGPNNNKTIEWVMEKLFGNEKQQIMALENLSKYNLRTIKNKLKERIQSWKQKDKFKQAYLFELLSEQEIDMNIEIDSQVMNPIKHSIFHDKQFLIAIKEIEKHTQKQPQLYEMVVNQLQHYVLKIFPNKIKNGKELSKHITKAVKSLIDEEIELNDQEKKILQTLNK